MIKEELVILGHKCLGYQISTSDGTDYDCGYGSDMVCEDCVFVSYFGTNDKRRGKRPWAKKWRSTNGEVTSGGTKSM